MNLNTVTSPSVNPAGRPAQTVRGLKGLLFAALVMAPVSAHAANYVVTSTDDDGPNTLRAAIALANGTIADDAISFAVSDTITLTTSDLMINGVGTAGKLAINGGAAGATISGGGNWRIFNLNNGADVTLSNLTLRDGNGIGGPSNNNSDGGGAIKNNSGMLTVNGCTLTNNSTTNGGGAISNDNGTLMITNSTLASNSADDNGGAIASLTIAPTDGQTDPTQLVLIRNSTFTLNSTGSNGGAIYNDIGLVRIESCTIAGNIAPSGQGAGVATYGDDNARTRVQNSIIADNRTATGGPNSGSDVSFVNGDGTINPFVSQGSNAIGDGNATSAFNGTGDQKGVNGGQLALGVLGNNGTQNQTQTRALGTNSVAIDRGASKEATDQRGVKRPQGTASDIGAFEAARANRAPQLNNATFTTAPNVAFTQQLAGSDADGDNLTYTLSAGALPVGLALSAGGLITGTPTVAGRTDFSVDVSDGVVAPTSRFIIIVSAAPDGVGPVVTRGPLNASYTRDGLASILYTGTVRDVAQGTVTPIGVKQVLFQLRRLNNTAYSGNETDGFTTNLNRGYFPAFVSATSDGTTAGTSTFRRNFASFIPSASVLTAGAYSLVILGQDNLNNFSVEVVPVNITAAAAQAAKSAFGISGSGGGS